MKAASDVYSPVAGQVVAVNGQLAAAPELVNQQPYGEGWLLRLKPSAPLAGADLLDAAGYAAAAAES